MISGTVCIVIGEFVSVLADREWHEIYEVHRKYRAQPLEIHESLAFLESNAIIERDGTRVRLSEELNNSHMFLLNRIRRKSRLDLKRYTPQTLTNAKFYV